MKSVRRMILAGAALAFVVIQLIPVRLDQPAVTADLEAPPELKRLLRDACYDCHSSEVRRPWYGHVAPVSWLVAYDVNRARRKFSFSEWGRYDAKTRASIREEIWEEVDEEEMPLLRYRLLHSRARLNERDLAVLKAWALGTEGEDR
jgi:hypothetical protein